MFLVRIKLQGIIINVERPVIDLGNARNTGLLTSQHSQIILIVIYCLQVVIVLLVVKLIVQKLNLGLDELEFLFRQACQELWIKIPSYSCNLKSVFSFYLHYFGVSIPMVVTCLDISYVCLCVDLCILDYLLLYFLLVVN